MKEKDLFTELFQQEAVEKANKEKAKRERPSAVEAAKRKVLALPADVLSIAVFEPLLSEIEKYDIYFNELRKKMRACEDKIEQSKLYGDIVNPEERLETEDLRNLATIKRKHEELKDIIRKESVAMEGKKVYSKAIAKRKIEDKKEQWRQTKKEELNRDTENDTQEEEREDDGENKENDGRYTVQF